MTPDGARAGSPQWAAIVALADQAKGAPLGYINPSLYAIRCSRQNYGADFHDITTGNNQLFGTPVGFKDLVTPLPVPDDRFGHGIRRPVPCGRGVVIKGRFPRSRFERHLPTARGHVGKCQRRSS